LLSSGYQEEGTSKEARGSRANLRNLENLIEQHSGHAVER